MTPTESLSLRHYGASPGSHSHDHFQILLGLSGTLELEIAGHGMRVAPGGGCVIAPGDRHAFESSRGSVCLVLDSARPGWAHCIGLRHRATPPADALPLARYLASALQQGRPLAQAQGPALPCCWKRGSVAPATTHMRQASHAGAPSTGRLCSNGQRSSGTVS